MEYVRGELDDSRRLRSKGVDGPRFSSHCADWVRVTRLSLCYKSSEIMESRGNSYACVALGAWGVGHWIKGILGSALGVCLLRIEGGEYSSALSWAFLDGGFEIQCNR